MNPRIKYLFVLFLLFHFDEILSQEGAIENAIQMIQEQYLVDETQDEIDASWLYDQLLLLSEHPININNNEIDKLIELGLINQVQKANIDKHINKYGPINAIEELMQVPDFSMSTIKMIKAFIHFERLSDIQSIHVGKVVKESKNDFTIHYETLLQRSKAYNNIAPIYIGNPARLMIKYNAKFYTRWRFGINIEKDAGEKINWNLKHPKPGFDHYSGYLFYRGKGFFKSIIIGDFQCGFAQGLTFWRGYSFGKSSNAVPVRKVNVSIRPHTGLDEYNFLRGIALNVAKSFYKVNSFLSFRKLDATPTDSSLQHFSSIIQNGYHRNASEIYKAGLLNEILWGSSIRLRLSNWDLGASYAHQLLSSEIINSQNLSSKYKFSGSSNFTVGIDADLSFKNGHLFSELSMSENKAIAYLIGTVITPDPSFSLSLFHRNYSIKFHPITSNAFGENSVNQNESGTYIGIEYKISRKILLNAYYDSFKFPWLKYRTPNSSYGNDYLVNFIYKRSKKQRFSLRYRYKITSERISNSNKSTYKIRQQIRLAYEQTINDLITLRYRVDVQKVDFLFQKMGYLFFADLILQSPEKPFSISTRYALFNTDDYDTRIYAYERDLYFSYSIKPYFYQGQKVYLNFKWRFRRFFTISFRISHQQFPYLTSIGSGYDRIEGNGKTAIKLQLRIRW